MLISNPAVNPTRGNKYSMFKIHDEIAWCQVLLCFVFLWWGTLWDFFHTVDGRNPKQPPYWMVLKPVVNNGMGQLPFPQLVISPDFERTITSTTRPGVPLTCTSTSCPGRHITEHISWRLRGRNFRWELCVWEVFFDFREMLKLSVSTFPENLQDNMKYYQPKLHALCLFFGEIPQKYRKRVFLIPSQIGNLMTSGKWHVTW